MKDIHDVITHAKFGDDRLRGLGVVAGQISAFPIDFAGRPYNTLTLPCERVTLDLLTYLVILSTLLVDSLALFLQIMHSKYSNVIFPVSFSLSISLLYVLPAV